MNPLTMARAECCNYDGGNCLVRESQPYKQAQCNVDKCRCGYFENAVLPIAFQASPVDDVHRQERLTRDRAKYLTVHGVIPATTSDRACECGKPLGRREKYCETCRKKRARQSDRNTRARRKS